VVRKTDGEPSRLRGYRCGARSLPEPKAPYPEGKASTLEVPPLLPQSWREICRWFQVRSWLVGQLMADGT
jgi:hypothetical protein